MNLRSSFLISPGNVIQQLTFKKYFSRKNIINFFKTSDADSSNNISKSNRHINKTSKLTDTQYIETFPTDEIISKKETSNFCSRRSPLNLKNKFKYALTSKKNVEGLEVQSKTILSDRSDLFQAVDLNPIINNETSLQSRHAINLEFKRTNETEANDKFKDNKRFSNKTFRSPTSTIKSKTWISKAEQNTKPWIFKKKKLPVVQGEILFGVNPVLLALQEKRRTFYTLYLKKSLSESKHLQRLRELAKEFDIPQVVTDLHTLDGLTQHHTHQGICLDASKISSLPLPEESGQIDGNLPLWLVMDRIQDPMNFGAVIRSAYYLGVDRVIISEKNSCRLSPVVSKASSGALELLPIFHINNLINFLQEQQVSGWEIIGSFVNPDKTDVKTVHIEEFSITKPTILILGNESKGVSSALLELCHYSLMIDPYKPLHPGVDSLNVSVAAGILLFNLSRSRQKQNKSQIFPESTI